MGVASVLGGVISWLWHHADPREEKNSDNDSVEQPQLIVSSLLEPLGQKIYDRKWGKHFLCFCLIPLWRFGFKIKLIFVLVKLEKLFSIKLSLILWFWLLPLLSLLHVSCSPSVALDGRPQVFKLSPPYLPLPPAASQNAVFDYFKILNWIINRCICLYKLIENS